MLLRERPEPVYWDEAGDVQMQMGGAITLTAEYHPYVDLSSRDYNFFLLLNARAWNRRRMCGSFGSKQDRALEGLFQWVKKVDASYLLKNLERTEPPRSVRSAIMIE